MGASNSAEGEDSRSGSSFNRGQGHNTPKRQRDSERKNASKGLVQLVATLKLGFSKGFWWHLELQCYPKMRDEVQEASGGGGAAARLPEGH